MLGVCLALSFLFSGMEAGVFALSRLRVRQQMRAGRASARVLHELLERPERFLWTILVGNTLVNCVVLVWVVAALHTQRGISAWSVAVFVCFVFLFYALFDLLPKMLFRQFPNRLCLFSARLFRVVYLLLLPLVAFVESSSNALLRWTGGKVFSGRLFGNREELRLVMQESGQGFSTEERNMINRVLDLQTWTVRQFAKPLPEVVSVTTRTSLREAVAVAREHDLSRLPVWDERGGQRRIVGLVGLNSLLYQRGLDLDQPVANHIRPALYLPESERLEVALRRLQRGGQRLAIVLGPDQRECGLLSLEDIFKVIFGEVKL